MIALNQMNIFMQDIIHVCIDTYIKLSCYLITIRNTCQYITIQFNITTNYGLLKDHKADSTQQFFMTCWFGIEGTVWYIIERQYMCKSYNNLYDSQIKPPVSCCWRLTGNPSCRSVISSDKETHSEWFWPLPSTFISQCWSGKYM